MILCLRYLERIIIRRAQNFVKIAMEKFKYLLGMRKSEAIDEVTRILKSLGFTVKTRGSTVEGTKDSEQIKVEFRESCKGALGIPMTEVVFYCKKKTHDDIAKKIMFLRCGG